MISCEPVKARPQDPGHHWMGRISDQFPGVFHLWQMDPRTYRYAGTPRQDEIETAGQDPNISGLFETYRIPFRDLFRTMLQQTFTRFNIPRANGVDIGCGPTGEMVHERLPLSKDQRTTWRECDINPGSVEANKARHPGANVEVASMYQLRKDLNLGERRLDVVSGSSSLDAVIFIDDAVREVRESLKPGGFLVHFQDVRPGVHVGMEQLVNEGAPGPFQGVAPGNMPVEHLNPYGYVMPDGNFVSSVELFRRWLGKSITADSGWRLLQNEWLVAAEPTPWEAESQLSLMCMKVPLDPSYTQNMPMKIAYGVMTVAQKLR